MLKRYIPAQNKLITLKSIYKQTPAQGLIVLLQLVLIDATPDPVDAGTTMHALELSHFVRVLGRITLGALVWVKLLG